MNGDVPFLLCFGDPAAAARIAAYGLPVALFLTGLAGSLLHCLGMCGPFVLGQVAARSGSIDGVAYGELRRLKEGALLPYHLGRIMTYCGLGAMVAMVGSLSAPWLHLRLIFALLLTVAAISLLAQILPKLAAVLPGNPAPPQLSRFIARMAAKAIGPTPDSLFALWRFGLLLGFLPCGFLWGALAAAATSGTALGGAVAMAGFGIGTMPALIGLGWGGAFYARRYQGWLRRAALPLYGLNAAFLLWLAARLAAGVDGL